MSKRKRKSAAQIAADLEAEAFRRASARRAARNPENWGVNVNTKLAANKDVVTRKSGKTTHAKRTSWQDRVLTKDDPDWTSINRLADQIAIRKGEDGRPSSGPATKGSRELVNGRMMEAGDVVDAVLGMLSNPDRRLLLELLDPTMIYTVQATDHWRFTVQLLTGEKNPNSQAAVVRAAARNLTDAWIHYDNIGRVRVA